MPESAASLIRPKNLARPQRLLEEGRDWDVDPATGCWEWKHYRHGDYGYARCTNGPAHREVWRQAGRLLADEDHLHHRCENPGCVNPAHMEPKPPLVHLTEHRQAESTLTWDDVRAIRAASKASVGIYELAEKYALSIGTLHPLILNRTWIDPDYEPGVDRECEECSTAFRTTRVNKRFCSRACRSKWNGRRTHRRKAGWAEADLDRPARRYAA